MSTLKVNTIQNTSNVEMYLAKAWVNFDGTGTVAIRASGNVSSITDNGTGNYTVNFTTAMPDANFAVVGTGGNTGSGFGAYLVDFSPLHARTTSSVRVWTGSYTALQDTAFNNVAIFR